MGVLGLQTADQLIAVDVFAEPKVSGLNNNRSEHHEDVGNFREERFGPGLKRIGKYRDIVEAPAQPYK